jgi:hypothetical protein
MIYDWESSITKNHGLANTDCLSSYHIVSHNHQYMGVQMSIAVLPLFQKEEFKNVSSLGTQNPLDKKSTEKPQM